jgi:glycosyltransferase involved in cell wall biosynthesis
LGIDNSRGKYLIFIDSDDYILPDVLNEFGKILKTNDTADILITKMAEQYPNKDMCFMDERYKIEEFENNSKVQIIDWVFNRSQNTWPVVRYIVKSKFVIDNQIRFITGRLHEDLDWTSKLFLHATKFSFSDTYWYVHRIERPGSITTSKKAKNVLDVIDIVQMNIEDRAYDRLGDINKEVIFARLTRSLYCILCHYNHFDEQGKQEIKNRLIDSREVLRYTTRVKHKMFLYFSKIFGVGLGLHILGKIKGT